MDEQEREEYLKALDGKHNPDSVEDKGFGNLPDGKQQVRLDKLYVHKTEAKEGKPSRMQIIAEFEVINGPYAFRKVFKFMGLMTAEQLDYTTNDLRRLGITTFKWSDVEKQFITVMDGLYEITLKTKKGFQSVYINQKLDRDKVMVSKKMEEDVPF